MKSRYNSRVTNVGSKEETALREEQRHEDENTEGIGARRGRKGRVEVAWRGGGQLAAAAAAAVGEGQRSPNLV